MSTSNPTTKRRTSLPSGSSENVLSSVDTPRAVGTALVKHGKYVVAGLGGMWWTNLPDVAREVLGRERGWVKRLLAFAIGLHGITIAIFLYLVLFLPWFRGYIPNYPQWQQSARLRLLVPVLTGTIFLGWTSYVLSLSYAGSSTPLESLVSAAKGVANSSMGEMTGGEGMGVFGAMAGATALYALTLGLLGFVPPPKDVAVGKKQT